MIFSPLKRILCPYCLTETSYLDDIKKCQNPECQKAIPVQYIHNYHLAAPIFLQLIGWSDAGKTTYLQALTLMLMQLNLFWPNSYSYSALNEATHIFLRNVRNFHAAGVLPPKTQNGLLEPFLLLLSGMLRWRGRMLVARDASGDHFKSLEYPVKTLPYVLRRPTVFMLASLEDRFSEKEIGIDDLMSSYIETIAKHSPRFHKEGRRAVIVLNKADLVLSRLPLDLQKYLDDDPFRLDLDREIRPFGLDEMEAYVARMGHASDAIQSWLERKFPGRNLVGLARNNNIDLRFSIVSSTGFWDSNNQRPWLPAQPWRVLDPFFWALEFDRR